MIRVLWFSVTPSLYNPFSNAHHGGGWIASLEQIIRNIPDLELGIAFYFGASYNSEIKDGVKYYTLPNNNKGLLGNFFSDKKREKTERIKRYLEVIDDFKPDLIQIFGSENDFGLITEHTNLPVVIHMQGVLSPCHNALFPIGMNKYDFFFQKGLGWRRRMIGLRSEPSFRKNAEREIGILKSCKYFMGRTEWDKNIITLFNPDATYFHCEEALRDSFLKGDREWKYPESKRMRLISVISNPWYKGMDLILKTAKLLTENTSLDFEWNVFGVRDIRFFENKYKIKAKDVKVNIQGSVDKDTLVDALCSSHMYIHPGYIDNSPNSVCEAQYLGVPVVATNVGGISSLVKDGESGLLFPANDPYTLVSIIKKIYNDTNCLNSLSKNEKAMARERHNPESLGTQLESIYKEIYQSDK